MTATLVTLTAAGVLATMYGGYIAGVVLLIAGGAIAVQWFCIDPPGVEE
jgi:hypothetical protein